MEILDILDETNGIQIFDKFMHKFYNDDQPKVERDLQEIISLICILSKFKAKDFKPQFQETMKSYIRVCASEKLDFTASKIDETAQTVL